MQALTGSAAGHIDVGCQIDAGCKLWFTRGERLPNRAFFARDQRAGGFASAGLTVILRLRKLLVFPQTCGCAPGSFRHRI